MDHQRFDDLTRRFAQRHSRRRLLRGVLGGAVAGALVHAGTGSTAAQSTCAEGQLDCDGVCVDGCCDNANCGACGNVCADGFTCFEGVCDCPSGLCCEEGEVICGGTCVATCCDNNNCGACGTVCSAGETCFEGVCGCPSGNCGPVTLPSTGSGQLPRDRAVDWSIPTAVVAAIAALAAKARQLAPRTIDD